MDSAGFNLVGFHLDELRLDKHAFTTCAGIEIILERNRKRILSRMKKNLEKVDEQIRARLKACSKIEKNYWSFRVNGARGHMHSCFQYPGMMVPQMQEKLISMLVEVVPSIRSVYEPFVGSGTVMTEIMRNGFDFTGQDINPLAVLLCRAKSGPFFEEAIEARTGELIDSIKADGKTSLEANFPSLDKWFKDDVAKELSKIRRAIRKESYLWCRRFYWMSLAETVRLASNARNATFKLHIRPEEEIKTRNLSPIQLFKGILRKNLSNLSSQKKLLQESGTLYRGRYIGAIEIVLKDSSTVNTIQKASKQHDLLITSPPYGDNRSTVSYGQYSYLPLQWIDLEDIDGGLDKSWLVTAYEIDRRSLGGNLRSAMDNISELLDISESLKRTLQTLKKEPRDRQLRVAGFWRDLSRCIGPTLDSIKQDAYMLWVVGNRRIAGCPIPMDKILPELLAAKGAEYVTQVQRTIPRKRMATRNNISSTMRSETIIIMRKNNAQRTDKATR
jgi:hypothetical protein